MVLYLRPRTGRSPATAGPGASEGAATHAEAKAGTVCPSRNQKTIMSEAAQASHLVLDSRVIAETTGAKLTPGTVEKDRRNPLFRGDRPWEPNISNGYPNVLYDEQDTLYKCWYNPWIIDKAVAATPPEKRSAVAYVPDAVDRQPLPARDSGVCYATSRDGIRWEKPHLGIAEFAGNPQNNIVFSAETIPRLANASPDLVPSRNRGPHGAGVFKDSRERDPAKRYKMVFRDYSPAKPEEFYVSVAFSADGLHWRDVPCPETAAAGDTHNNALWAPELRKYVLFTRLWSPDRVVGRSESSDFCNWTESEVVLSNHRLGLAHQIYSMPVFRHGSIYIGLPAIYDANSGRVHTELAWSPDTVTWHRTSPGTPLIANTEEEGACDWGCVYASTPVFLSDRIRLYYMGDASTHHGWRDSGLCLACLRPDGFAGYEPVSDDAPAVIVTTPVTCAGRALRITADLRHGGSVRVMLIDERDKVLAGSRPVTGRESEGESASARVADVEVTDGDVLWEGGQQATAAKEVRLKFELDRAKLYSFRFS